MDQIHVDNSCPSLSTLQALVDGQLSAGEAQRAAEHMDGCQRCAQMSDDLERIRSADVHASSSFAAEPQCVRVIRSYSRASFTSPLPACDLRPGDRLGPYQLGELLGKGLSQVFKPTHVDLKKDFALKVLAQEQLAAANQFKREWAILGSLNFPHIVKATYAGSRPSGAHGSIANPAPVLCYAGICLCIVGKCIAYCRGVRVDATLVKTLAAVYVACGVISLCVGSVQGCMLFGGLVGALCLFLAERRYGFVGGVVVVVGVCVLGMSGLATPVLEVAFLFGGHCNYLSDVYPSAYATRSTAAIWHVAAGILIAACALAVVVSCKMSRPILSNRMSVLLTGICYLCGAWGLLGTWGTVWPLPYGVGVGVALWFVLLASCREYGAYIFQEADGEGDLGW